MNTTDDELLAEVRVALHEEVADVTAGPALLAAVRRERGRRRFRRGLVLVAPVAVAAAVAAAVVALPAREVPPAPVNAAHVKEMTVAALDRVSDHVMYQRAVDTDGGEYGRYGKPGQVAVWEMWRAADGSAFRRMVTVDGEPVEDMSFDQEADVVVDYERRTYWVHPGTPMTPAALDDVWTPQEIQAAIGDGLITVIGAEQVNGKPAIKLHRPARKAEVPMDLWVDATTHLPVQTLDRQEGATPYAVTWLPPTPENLAKLKTVVPPGFTEWK